MFGGLTLEKELLICVEKGSVGSVYSWLVQIELIFLSTADIDY
jgi:hypothetical protein